VGNSQVFDNGTNVGIGNATPNRKFIVQEAGTSTSGNVIGVRNDNTTSGAYINFIAGGSNAPSIGAKGNDITFTADGYGGTELLRVTGTGNLGLGVTPSAWLNTLNALQIGAAHLFGQTTGTGTVSLGNNVYLNSTPAYIYQYNGKATRYSQYDGQHEFYTAPSGTAGNAISFTQAMTLDASGRLGIGTTSPSGRLDVFSSSDVYTNISTSGNGTSAVLSLFNSSGVTDGAAIGYNVAMRFGTITGLNAAGFTERMRITSGGNLLIGTTTDIGTKLAVNGTTYTAGLSVNATAYQGNVTMNTGTTYIYNAGSGSHTFTLQSASGSNQVFIVKNASSRSLTIATTGGQAIIDNAGASTTTFTLAANKAMIIQQDGGSTNYIISIY
jgi:hypothetical protein